MAHLLGDLRFGLRLLRKNPGPTVAAVLALGLGIGLTTAAFSIVDGAILKGLPFEEPDRIVHLEAINPSQDQQELEPDFEDFADWRQRQTSFEGLAAFEATTVNLSGSGGRPERVSGCHMSANAFELLRAKPLMGRLFLPGEDAPGAAPVAVVSYGLWRSRFGADPQVLGRTVRVNGVESTIVGIMPQGFNFPLREVVWSPLRRAPGQPRGEQQVSVFGRLEDGVSLERAQAELAGIAKALEKEHPETNRGLGVVVKPFTEEYVDERVTSLLYSMLGAVFLVLLLACVNVAGLMLARASQRTRELAIRSALGAGRRRVLAQILIESLLLSLVGAALGIVIARWGIHLFNQVLASADEGPPFWIQISINSTALLFALGATVVAAVLSGLVPALQASRTDAGEILKDEGRGSTSLRLGRFSRAIVTLEVAFSCAALVGAGLMVKSVMRVRDMDRVFETRDTLTFRIALYEADYPEEADRTRFWRELLPRLAAVPGVEALAATSLLPGLGSEQSFYALEGRAYPTEQDLPWASSLAISPGFFDTFGGRLLAGRDFDARDLPESQPVVIVNRRFAAQAWPGDANLAVGKRLRVGKGEDAEWRTVVGVAPDLQMAGIQGGGKDEGFYLPLAQATPVRVSVAMRARGNPLGLLGPVRDQVATLDPDLPVYFVKTMEKALVDDAFFFNLFGGLFGLFGVVALALAAVGIYGVVAFSVHQRTQEIGVRMALGAGKSNVLSMVLKQGMRQLLLGLGLGLPLAALVSQGLSGLLFDVRPGDPQTFFTVALLLAGVAIAACLIPARRAAGVDPLVAIRYD